MNEVTGDIFELLESGKYDCMLYIKNCAGIPIPSIGVAVHKRYALDTGDVGIKYAHELLGTCDYTIVHTTAGSVTIAGSYACLLPGKPNDRRFDYAAFESSLVKLREQLILTGSKSLIFPKIATGCQGGRWRKAKNIMEQTLHDIDLTLVRRPVPD